jgi:hypothetical protein
MPNWFRLKTDSKIRLISLITDIMLKEETGEELNSTSIDSKTF